VEEPTCKVEGQMSREGLLFRRLHSSCFSHRKAYPAYGSRWVLSISAVSLTTTCKILLLNITAIILCKGKGWSTCRFFIHSPTAATIDSRFPRDASPAFIDPQGFLAQISADAAVLRLLGWDGFCSKPRSKRTFIQTIATPFEHTSLPTG
jgi:hypothetical protein